MSEDLDDPSAARVQLWSLREDALVEDGPGYDELVAVTRWAEIKIDGADDTVRESLRRMSMGPVSLANVLVDGRSVYDRTAQPGSSPANSGVTDSGVADTDLADHDAWSNVLRVLDLLSSSVVRSLGMSDGDGLLLSAVPIAAHASFHPVDVDPGRPVRLSRFAAIRPHGHELLLESPLAPYHVVLHRHLASRVAISLSGPTTVDEIAGQVGVAPEVVADIVGYLVATGIVLVGEWAPRAPEARFAEDDDPALARWSYHDLLFHSRSRMGRYGGQSGPVFPHADKHPSPDLVKPVRSGRRIRLYRPRIADLIATDPPLTSVLENTRLGSELSDRQVTAEQVGELLFRAARIRSVSSESTGTEVRYDVSDRPYLSINGLYELELYVSVHNCVGLPRGTYHYDPEYHVLTLVNDSQLELDELLDSARVAARTTWQPPILITMTARVARFSWMYGGIGYSLTLAHVGALQQTLCMVANAMGLAACAPAVDPGDVLDSALQLGWPAEVGVGEFLVG